MSQNLPRRTAGRSSYAIPRLEALEDRCTPASIVVEQGILPGGRDRLTVWGTDYADTIRITDSGTAEEGSVVVTCTDWLGRTTGGANDNVGEVRVFAGIGADTVIYELQGNLTTTRKLDVDLGIGNDTFSAYLIKAAKRSVNFPDAPWWVGCDLEWWSSLTLDVFANSGRDTINVYANHDVDIRTGASLLLNLEGDLGNDAINVDYEGELDGTLFMVADGGLHDDTVSANLEIAGGSSGTLGDPVRPVAQVRDGGGGTDDLTFILADHSAGQADLYASIVISDLSPGDEAVFTPNVRLIW